MTDEQRLIEKLARVEALFAGATTDGERVAAAEARTRILARLRELERDDPPIEHRFTLGDVWARRLFLALLRRYDLNPYRYSGQRYTTAMVKAPRLFIQETLWPEYTELHDTLHRYLHDVTERVIAQVVRADASEAAEVAEPRGLPAGTRT